MMVGAWRAVAETDLKRVLAYSTISALGMLMMLFGLGNEMAVTAALVYLGRSCRLQGRPVFDRGHTGARNRNTGCEDLGGLRQAMPAPALAGLLAACSMAGIPAFFGFVGKELVYGTLLNQVQPWSLVLLASAIAASVLLESQGFIAGLSPFVGPLRGSAPTHPVALALALPPVTLAAAGLFIGLLPAIVDVPISLAASNTLGHTSRVHLAIWHGLNPVLLLSLLTLVGVAALYRWREKLRDRIWPRSIASERLYTGVSAAGCSERMVIFRPCKAVLCVLTVLVLS